jgi:hypothetical protein
MKKDLPYASFTALSLSVFCSLSAFASGNFAPPGPIVPNHLKTSITVKCDPSGNILLLNSSMGQVLIANPYSVEGQDDDKNLQLLYNNVDAETVKKISVIGNEVLVRNSSSNNQWLAIGTIDTDTYCTAEKIYNDAVNAFTSQNPKLPIPESILSSNPEFTLGIDVYPGVSFQITRSLPMALCWTNVTEGGASRPLVYSVKITDQNHNTQVFTPRVDLEFGDSADCKNFSESPWTEIQ